MLGSRTFKQALLGATMLVAFSGGAFAGGPTVSANDIGIITDANGVNQLSITQDDGNTNNAVVGVTSGAMGALDTSMSVNGGWQSIAITQTGNGAGGSNLLGANVTAATGGSTTSQITANYTTEGKGDNTHVLVVGATTAPTTPSITVNVTNTGDSNNTITDTMDTSGTLTYALTVNGTADKITNVIDATANESLTENVLSSNTLVNTSVTGGADQTHVFSTDATSGYVNYALNSAAGSSNVELTGVVGTSLAPVDVVAYQTANAGGANANLTLSGTGVAGTFGMLDSQSGFLPANYTTANGFASGTQPAVLVYQNSVGATLNANVAATGTGATILIKQ